MPSRYDSNRLDLGTKIRFSRNHKRHSEIIAEHVDRIERELRQEILALRTGSPQCPHCNTVLRVETGER